MLRQISQTILLIAAAFPLIVQSHEGHDHSHWTSNIIHLSLYSCIALAIFIAIRHVKKSKSHQLKNNKG